MPYAMPVDVADARDILLVKAVEQAIPDAVQDVERTDAARESGAARDGAEWFARRSRRLLAGPLREYAPLARLAVRPRFAWSWTLLGGAVAGAASSFLGPQGQVHVLFNPLFVLVVWNLAMYAGMAVWGAVRRARRTAGARPPEIPGFAATVEPRRASRDRRVPWFSRWILGRWWAHRVRAAELTDKIRRKRTVLAAFGREWLKFTRPAWAPAVWRALHVGAIGLAIGAFAGTYVRGLGLRYDFVWRSTFVTDPGIAAALLRAAYGPACALTGAPVPTRETALALMSDEGLPAAGWIHLLAISAVLYIVLPRTILLAAELVRGAVAGRRTALDLSDPYWLATVEDATRRRIDGLLADVRSAVGSAAPAFLSELETIVAERLFDERIVPKLWTFRETGGRIADLRAELERECAAFAPELGDQLIEARARFEMEASRQIERALDSEAARAAAAAAVRDGADLQATVHGGAGEGIGRVGESIGRGLSDRGAALAGSTAAVVAGSLAGGFGAHLGTAVLVGLGLTGPGGFLVGALAGGLAAAGLYLFGRDKLASGVEKVAIPSGLLRTVFSKNRWDTLIERGREQTRAEIRRAVEEDARAIGDDLEERVRATLEPAIRREMAVESWSSWAR